MTVGKLSSDPRRDLPQGVVTLLFSDIEGSTKLLDRLGGEGYAEVLATHHGLLRASFTEHAGREMGTEGDAFFVAFSSPTQAVAAAVEAQLALEGHRWPQGCRVRVRIGLHTGEPLVVDDSYVGMDVHRAARICSAAHGGQVLVSAQLQGLLAGRGPGGAQFRDLGEHRLKDLPEPVHLLQVEVKGLPSRFPPLRSLPSSTNVPRPGAPLVGRQQECRELRDLLFRPGVRLVTVTGTGGVGKTRLATAVALDLVDDFPFGVYLVELAEVTDADDILPSVARVLEVPLDGGQPLHESVADHIADRRMLLVLDNFEQVVDGAPAVSRLLRACPGLTVVVTSRFLLGLQDEHEYTLRPMRLPRTSSLEEADRSDAVRLFVERASRARHGFELTAENVTPIARICSLVDGLPLAIELAAARTRLFPPRALADRLEGRLDLLAAGGQDTPERHRTLRATIDWTYALLAEEDQRSFLDLAVFSGGARLESIEAVVGDERDLLDRVTALVDHSLADQHEDADGQPRFSMLQTVRDYALARLREDPPHYQRLRERHARHYLARVEELVSDVTPPGSQAIEWDRNNVRAALSFWLDEPTENGQAATQALRLAGAMGIYWYRHGQSLEGSGWIERSLAAALDPPKTVKALALRSLGYMSEQRQDLEDAAARLTDAIHLYRQLGDRPGEASCLTVLGLVARSAGRPADAEAFLRDAVAICEETGDEARLRAALNNLGLVHLYRGDWAEARAIFEENLRRDRAALDDWGAACTAVNLGEVLVRGGNAEAARPVIREAMVEFLALSDVDGVMEAIEVSVGLAAARRQWAVAVRLAESARVERQRLGLPGSPVDRLRLESWVRESKEQLDPTAIEAVRREGAAMTYEQATGCALSEVLER